VKLDEPSLPGIRYTCWNGHRWRELPRVEAFSRVSRKASGRCNGLRFRLVAFDVPEDRIRLYDRCGNPVSQHSSVAAFEAAVMVLTRESRMVLSDYTVAGQRQE